MSTVYIGIGSNIEPEKNLARVANLLRHQWPKIEFASVYKSKAMEVTDQADFLNTVATFESDESPEDILKHLQEMEQTLKKSVTVRYGPRTIDLDLLLIDDLVRTEDPILPHPKMHERHFVLAPLIELEGPGFMHPTLDISIGQLGRDTAEQACEKVEMKM